MVFSSSFRKNMLRELGEAVETGREGSKRARRYRSVGKCRCARCKIRAYHCGAFEVGNVATVGSSVGLLRWVERPVTRFEKVQVLSRAPSLIVHLSLSSQGTKAINVRDV
jgi:hypothetical protein